MRKIPRVRVLLRLMSQGGHSCCCRHHPLLRVHQGGILRPCVLRMCPKICLGICLPANLQLRLYSPMWYWKRSRCQRSRVLPARHLLGVFLGLPPSHKPGTLPGSQHPPAEKNRSSPRIARSPLPLLPLQSRVVKGEGSRGKAVGLPALLHQQLGRW